MLQWLLIVVYLSSIDADVNIKQINNKFYDYNSAANIGASQFISTGKCHKTLLINNKRRPHDQTYCVTVPLPSSLSAWPDNLFNPYNLTLLAVRPIIELAVTEAIARGYLKDHNTISWTFVNTHASPAIGPYVIIDSYYRGHADIVIGLANIYTLAPLGRTLPYWGLPLISTIGLVTDFDHKANYALLTRISGTYNNVGKTLVELLRKWEFYAGLTLLYNNPEAVEIHTDQTLPSSECNFALKALKQNMMYEERRSNDTRWDSSPTNVLVLPFNEWQRYKEPSTFEKKIIENLKNASVEHHVIILCASPDTVRQIMLAAHELGMTKGEYVFINIDVSTGAHQNQPWHRANENLDTNNKAEQAYKALKTISLRRSHRDQYKDFEAKVSKIAEEKYNYSAVMGKSYQMNNFISAFYDAVLLYAIALNETISMGGDPRNGTEITSRMWNRTFQGISGEVQIDENGDRYSDYALLDYAPKTDTEGAHFKEVAYYSGSQQKLFEHNKDGYFWPGVNGKPPADSPVCGWDRSLCPDETMPIWAYPVIALAIIVAIMCIISFFVLRHYRSEAELAAMSWRIRWEELTGEERRKEKKKTRGMGTTAWLLDDTHNGEQMNPLIERTNSQNSLSQKPSSDGPDKSPLPVVATSAGRKISQYVLSKFSRNKSCDNQGNHIELGSPSGSHKETDRKSSKGTRSYRGSESTRKGSEAALQRKHSIVSMKWQKRQSIQSDTSAETLAPDKQIYTKHAIYKGQMVALKYLKIDRPKIELTRPMLLELKKMKDLNHDHINRFVGACVDYPNYCIVTEYCSKGSLEDLLASEGFQLDKMMLTSLIHDLVKGMLVIHNNAELRSHGYLKPSNCVIDSRFVLKITDFGLQSLHALETMEDNPEDYSYSKRMLWTAPELLRKSKGNPIRDSGTRLGDVYSFAIILHEMLYNKGPFYNEPELEPKEIIERVMEQSTAIDFEPYRPSLDEKLETQDIDDPEFVENIKKLMQKCWSENPIERPDFASIRKIVHGLNKEYETVNIVDNLLKRMTQYADNLEELVKERTADYLEEKHKVENLLHQLLPPTVADTLIRGEPVMAESFESVTIYFSDIVGFTALSASSSPMEVVTLLGDLYSKFDSCIADYDVYKVETIGDAYMVVSGLPIRNGDKHAMEMCRMALSLLNLVKSFRIRHRPGEQLRLRIGMHSGSVCAGVVGLKMPRYCLFGDTVNTASRMESSGLPLKIHVSRWTHEIVMASSEANDFEFETRGEVEMKGKGKQFTYWLKRYKAMNVPKFDIEENILYKDMITK